MVSDLQKNEKVGIKSNIKPWNTIMLLSVNISLEIPVSSFSQINGFSENTCDI